MAVLIVLAAAFALLIIAAINDKKTVASHWQHLYENEKFSSGDFYKHIEAELAKREITGLEIGRQSFTTYSIFSERREYMTIRQREYIFYVCAAPFGTGTFVSWWLCVFEYGIVERIPVLNRLLGKDRAHKSFYQMDTEGMYKSAIHSAVQDAANKFTSAKGERGMTDLERAYKDIR